MRTPGIDGVTSIECSTCGRAFDEYDPPEVVDGMTRVRARCLTCRTEQVFHVDRWRGETSVSPVSSAPWEKPA